VAVARRPDVVGNAISLSTWATISRITGFARAATIAAVLGPTYLGNTFQATNVLPNLTYEFLTGSLFASLLVPTLVRHVDLGQTRATERLVGGFLGVMIATFALAVGAAILAGPLVLHVLALGVHDRSVADAQSHVGWILMAMLMPQVILYGIAGTGGAVQNAHGRFAVAAAAPALENVGVIATMGTTAVLFGTGATVENVTLRELLVLGLGTTAAVGLHAGAQWWGARRVGITMIPRAGWRDPEVRALVGRAVPSLGYAGLNSLRLFAVLVVANHVRGGIVAFQLALNFFYLPVNAGARPIGIALLPRLSRLYHDREPRRFREELVKGASRAFFLTVPAAVAFVTLARPLADAVSFGQMANGAGVALVAASLASLAPGILGESGFVMATYGSYARHDVRSPFTAMLIRTGVSLAGMVVAFLLADGSALLVGLGLAVSAGNLLSALQLGRRLNSELPGGSAHLAPALRRAFGASAVMAAPAYLIAAGVPAWFSGRASGLIGIFAALAVGSATFLGLQHAWGSPELSSFVGDFKRLRPGAEP
jgi:putative peptidoglycan lipid II flippase